MGVEVEGEFAATVTSSSERTEYMRQTNANMLVLCQLESIRAFENLDAILEVKGFDGYVFGPNDLAQSMEKGSSLDFS